MDWEAALTGAAAGTFATWGFSALKKTPVGIGASIFGGIVSGVVGEAAEDGGLSMPGLWNGILKGAVGGLLGFGAGRFAVGIMAKRASGAAPPDNVRGVQSALVGVVSTLVRVVWNGAGGGSDGGGTGAGDEVVALRWSGYEAAEAVGVMGTPPFVQDSGVVAQGIGFLLHPVELNPIIADWYGGVNESFARSLAENHLMFGDLEKKEELSLTPIPTLVVPAAVSVGSEGANSYAQAVQSMNERTAYLGRTQENIPNVVEKVEDISKVGLDGIATLTMNVNRAMLQFPPGNIDIDFVTLATKAIEESLRIMSDAALAARSLAQTIQDPGWDPRAVPSTVGVADTVGRIDSGLADPGLWPGSSQTPPVAEVDADEFDTENEMSPELERVVDDIRQAVENTAPLVPDLGAGSVAPAGGLMEQMLMRNMLSPMGAQQGMGGAPTAYPAAVDPAPHDRGRAVTQLPPVTPQVHTTPWSTQNAATTTPAVTPQPQPQTGPGPGVTSSQTGGTPPRTPGEDGGVEYTFPDRPPQTVSPTVASGLDAAFANIKGTDAQEAYADTDAKWTDPEKIGARVEPYLLMTGDVATWDERTAVVVFGVGEEATLEVIVDGKLVPFTPEMSDSAGEFGQFTGFRHPPGIELEAGDKTGDAAVPAGDQQSAGASGETPFAVASV